MLQSFEDEFDLSEIGNPKTPAIPGSSLTKTSNNEGVVQRTFYISNRRWKTTTPDSLDKTQNHERCTRIITIHKRRASSARESNVPGNGLLCTNAQPRNKHCTGRKMGWKSQFQMKGRADSDYAKDLETRRSISGVLTFLCGAVNTTRSKMMPIVALSVTEVELFAAVMCVQDMVYIM
jgi:hypothetical protein